MNNKLKSRLINWKFDSAKKYLTETETTTEMTVVVTLSKMFGDIGWFYGDLAILVQSTLISIGIKGEEKAEYETM